WIKQPELTELGGQFAYPGFSLSTAANYFVNIAGKSVFQGVGDVTYQGAATWTQQATNWDATTHDKAQITSAKELIISSGTASAPKAKEMPIGTSGAELEPPKFDDSDLVDLMLDHASENINHVLDTTVETSKIRIKMGLKSLPVPKLSIWQKMG